MKPMLLLLPLLAACASATPPGKSERAETVDASTLAAYHWRLQAANHRDGQRIDALFGRPQLPLQLDLDATSFGVSNACNWISGGYHIEHGRLVVGLMTSTAMGCMNPAVAQLDGAISERLEGKPHIQLRAGAEPHLLLTTDSGDVLDFVGVPTAETRYGGSGETVFLEVDAHKHPCSHPLMPNQRCLKVREVHYDANGLASGTPGEWRLLSQNIEGYAHEDGLRNVLRVKRYEIKNPPADAPSQALVLDMVVMSERAEP